MYGAIRDVTGRLSPTGQKRNRRNRIFQCFRMLLILFVFGLVFCLALNGYICQSTASRICTVEEAAALQADCILVLGAGVREDGSPSHMLEDRLEIGVDLYMAGASEKLLMSGDHGRTGYNEVGTMKRFAVAAGAEDEDVFMDHAGFSTYESLYRARDVFGARKILIVTQKYHLYRALYIAEKLGLEAYGIPADLRTYAGQPFREVREIAARVKDAFGCILQPKPTYLGEAIPISGDGGATNDEIYKSSLS